jgi:putative nucleotidyltransferase with HDIG domain
LVVETEDRKGVTSELLTELLRKDLEAGELVLPMLPEIATRVVEIIEDPDASLGDIARVLRADVSLTARLLALANSPFLRGREPVRDIKMAVNRLGPSYLQHLVSALAAEQMFTSGNEQLKRYLKQVWAHSLKVASVSHMLAVQHTNLKGEEAFVAGLIHDIGTLPVIRYAETHGLELARADLDRVVSELHPEIGALIAESWHFPQELVAVVREHEHLQREGGPRADLVDVVIAANVQSHMASGHPHAQVNVANIPAFRKLGLAPEIDPAALEFALQLENDG